MTFPLTMQLFLFDPFLIYDPISFSSSFLFVSLFEIRSCIYSNDSRRLEFHENVFPTTSLSRTIFPLLLFFRRFFFFRTLIPLSQVPLASQPSPTLSVLLTLRAYKGPEHPFFPFSKAFSSKPQAYVRYPPLFPFPGL